MKNLNEHILEFLEYLEIERNVSPLTIRNYKHYLLRFSAWVKEANPAQFDDPTKINQDAIRRYRLYLSRVVDLHNVSLMRITQNYHLIALRAFLRFLAKKDINVLSPEKIELAKAESRSLAFITRDQLAKLLNMIDISTVQGLRDRCIIELLFSTGMRISELVRLNREQIDLASREIGIIGKGRRPRVVFISDKAAEWFKDYIRYRTDTYKPLFVRYSGKKVNKNQGEEGIRLSARSIQRAVEKYVKLAKLPVKITPHGVRHSFATDMLSSGADLRAIQEMLGHKNISTTQIYTHVTNPQLKEIHQKFHDKK